MIGKYEDLIVPVCKRALIIGISNYKEWRKKVSTIKDLLFSENDVKEVEKLFKNFGYEVTSNSGQQSIEASFIDSVMKDWLQIAKNNYANGQYTHLFIYFSGHGVLSSDFNETCGVDSFGNLIPWDHYAKMFSQRSKTFTFFFLDQCRQKPPPTIMNQLVQYKILGKVKTGISVVKYCCAAGQLTTNDTTAGKTLSTETENFIGKLNKAFTRTDTCIDSFNVNLEWSIPKQEWGDWILFKDTTDQLPASNFIPISEEAIEKKIRELIWEGDEDYAAGNIKELKKKETVDYIFVEARKESEEFLHKEEGSVGLGLTIMTLGIMAAIPQSSEMFFKLKPNYPAHAERQEIEELKQVDIGKQDYRDHKLSLSGYGSTDNPQVNSRLIFAAARPLQKAAYCRFKVLYTCTYRVPKEQYMPKAIKLLEKEQQQKKR